MNTEELTEFIRTKGRDHFKDSEKIAIAVQKAAKNSDRPPQVIADSVNQALAISMSTIKLLQKQLKNYDKAIEKQLRTITQTLTSIKGIGNCEAADSPRKCDPEFKRCYDLKFKEVTKHQHKRALVLTAGNLVRLVYTLLKTNRLYIPPEV